MARARLPAVPPAAGSPALHGNLFALVSTLLWASSFPVTEYLLLSWDPMLLCLGRLAVAAAFLALLGLVSGRGGEFRRAPWGDVVFLGAVGVAAPVFLTVLGQSRSDAVTVAIISTALPLIAAIMGWVLDGQRPRPSVLVGIVLALAGGGLAALDGVHGPAGLRGGEVLVLGSMTLWIWYSRAAMVRLRGRSDLAISTLTFVAGTAMVAAVLVVALPLGLAQPRLDLRPTGLTALLWLGSMAIGLSVLLWFAGARRLGLTVAAIHTNLAPFYVMLMALAAGGSVSGGQLTGAMLVAGGALLAQVNARTRPAA